MPQKGQKKKPEHERRQIAERYRAWRQNMPKRIMAEHGIGVWTLHQYVREFQR